MLKACMRSSRNIFGSHRADFNVESHAWEFQKSLKITQGRVNAKAVHGNSRSDFGLHGTDFNVRGARGLAETL